MRQRFVNDSTCGATNAARLPSLSTLTSRLPSLAALSKNLITHALPDYPVHALWYILSTTETKLWDISPSTTHCFSPPSSLLSPPSSLLPPLSSLLSPPSSLLPPPSSLLPPPSSLLPPLSSFLSPPSSLLPPLSSLLSSLLSPPSSRRQRRGWSLSVFPRCYISTWCGSTMTLSLTLMSRSTTGTTLT